MLTLIFNFYNTFELNVLKIEKLYLQVNMYVTGNLEYWNCD